MYYTFFPPLVEIGTWGFSSVHSYEAECPYGRLTTRTAISVLHWPGWLENARSYQHFKPGHTEQIFVKVLTFNTWCTYLLTHWEVGSWAFLRIHCTSNQRLAMLIASLNFFLYSHWPCMARVWCVPCSTSYLRQNCTENSLHRRSQNNRGIWCSSFLLQAEAGS